MPELVAVSPSSLESLELPEVLSLVAALASTDVGRSRLAALEPVAGERLKERRAALREMTDLLAEGTVVERLEEDVAGLLSELAGPRPELGGKKLLRWRTVLETAKAAMGRVGETEPTLSILLGECDDLGWLIDRIAATIDPRGEVRDDASPALARLRKRIGRARRKAYADLGEVLGENAASFSEDTTPLHNGRLVLMLRAGERGRMDGLVHGRSSTGRSLYFEPMAAVDSNNALQEAIAEEEVERRRLLRELAEALLGALDEIEASIEILGRLDTLQAAWRFGELVDGRLVELSDGDLVLLEARHPLLTPETRELREEVFGHEGHAGGVTPLDLELTGVDCSLVITGPNAGGKTVALKTVGLAVLLTLCGLPVPIAPGSRVPPFGAIVGVVGDEQDLMQDRSTFSGRLLRLREAWRSAGESTLVLLDELGSGTDPEEGSALSIALLERLVSTRTRAIVTTHLVALAAAATEIDGAVCASMEFDRETRAPTFRLQVGPPGGSEAIALARQLDLPGEWLDRAESLVGEEHGKLQRLLAEIETLRGELGEETRSLARLRQQVKAERQAATDERTALESERHQLARRTRRDLDAFRRRVRERMDEEMARLRDEIEVGRKRGSTAAAVGRVFEESAPPEILQQVEVDPEAAAPAVGDRVGHVEYSWEGTLEGIEGERATVAVAGKRMQTRIDRLRRLDEPSEPPRAPRAKVDVSAPEVSRELDLIGSRVDEALDRVDRYLDQALLVPHREVRLIHGHGSGRLRKAVRRFLDGHAAVESSRPGGDREGGDGATVVRLRI